MTTTADRISATCDGIRDMLLAKNAAYGDSVGDPLRIFSRADKMEAIRVRIDDKLSRITKGTPYPGDDNVMDLIGYLVLFVVNDPASQAVRVTRHEKYVDKDGDVWTVQQDGKYKMSTGDSIDYDVLARLYGPLSPVQ